MEEGFGGEGEEKIEVDFDHRCIHNVVMRVIKRPTLIGYGDINPDAKDALTDWFITASTAEWRNLTEVRRDYSHADPARVASGKIVTIFNIRGNHYRLVTAIHYNTQRVFILRFMTHAQYSRNRWKDQL